MLGWITLITFIAGVIGTGLGGLIGAFFKKDSNKVVSLLLSFAGGVMIGIVCFDLIPLAIESPSGNTMSNLWVVVVGVVVGFAIIYILNGFLDNKSKGDIDHLDENHPDLHDDLDELIHSNSLSNGKKNTKSLFLAGIIMALAIALHNLPEGMVIGASYVGVGTDELLTGGAFALALVIGLHNIPEGMAVSVPLINGGMNKTKAVLLSALAGAPTILGALLGYALGNINAMMQSIMLSLASGAMLYVVFAELFPLSILICKNKLPSITALIGMLAGLLMVFI